MRRTFILIVIITINIINIYDINTIKIVYKIIYNKNLKNDSSYCCSIDSIKLFYEDNQIDRILFNKNSDIFYLYISDSLIKNNLFFTVFSSNKTIDTIKFQNFSNFYVFENYSLLLTNYKILEKNNIKKNISQDSNFILKNQNEFQLIDTCQDSIFYALCLHHKINLKLKIHIPNIIDSKDFSNLNDVSNSYNNQYKNFIHSNNYNYLIEYYPNDLLNRDLFFQVAVDNFEKSFSINLKHFINYKNIGILKFYYITENNKIYFLKEISLKDILMQKYVNFMFGNISLSEYKLISDIEYFKKCKPFNLFRKRKKIISYYGVCIDCHDNSIYYSTFKRRLNRKISQLFNK
ncbi:MAG: hypothetical protein LBV69_02260 [Bacteroidales bacterium]|jgi:hypothetical protein|nr:hypothetical protein [Bacteroidales bacterium]